MNDSIMNDLESKFQTAESIEEFGEYIFNRYNEVQDEIVSYLDFNVMDKLNEIDAIQTKVEELVGKFSKKEES